MSLRVLFYVQHLLGVGHLKRAEILAQAMAAAGFAVTVAFGGRPVPEVSFRGIKVAALPAATIADEDFSTLLDADGKPVDEAWRRRRATALLDLYHAIEPDALLIEMFPFGRRQFRFELMPLLEAAQASKPRPVVACSVRDILVTSKKPGRSAETVDILRRYFDAVLVHGDPTLIPFGATFPEAGEIDDLIRYTGYVANAAAVVPGGGGNGEVLVSAGGGAVGAALLRTAMQARPLTQLEKNVWRFLSGPNLPDSDFRELAAGAGDRAIVERFRTDFSALLAASTLSISQAGYNTIMDILGSGARAVVVPYETKGETEQRLRADLLAAKGVLTVVPAAALTPERLADAIERALTASRPARPKVDLSGAATTARLIRDLCERGKARV